MTVLTGIKFETIFYTYQPFIPKRNKYCEKETCTYKCRNIGHCRIPFSLAC
jgi:hypothetical protein